jgi:O-antigen ligase
VRPRETLAWIVVALLFIDLTFFSGASNFLAAPQSRILNQVLVLGAVVVAAVVTVRRRSDLRSPLLLPGAAWVAAVAIATLTSQRPAASLEALALLLLCAPAYLVVKAALADRMLRPRIDWLVIVATTVFVIAYLLQALTQWASWWSVAGPSIPPLRPGDVGLTVGTVNAVALYLELLAPIAVWLAWVRWRSRPFSIGLAVLTAFALLVTGSRGAWLGTIGGAVALGLLAWRTGRVSIPSRLHSRQGSLLVMAVGLLGVLLLPALVGRMLSGDAGRIELWSAAWSMFTGSPITGVGPGAWPSLRASTPISDDNLAVLATSHNSVLQILAETGVIGGLAAVWLSVAIGRLAWRAVAHAEDPNGRVTALVASASLVAAAVHSVVDMQFHLPAMVLLVLHLAARLQLVADGAPSRRDPAPTSGTVLGVSAASVVVGALLLVPIDVAMVRAALGNNALDRGDAQTALAHFDAAVGLHDLPPYRLGQAIARTEAGDLPGAADALAALDRAEPFTFVLAQEASLAADPGPFWARADAAGSYDPTATVNIAAGRFVTDRAAAIHDLAAAMAEVPPLVYSVRPASLFDDDAWEDAREMAISRIGTADPVTAAAVALLAGRAGDAAVQRSAVPEGLERRALELLATATAGGSVDVETARALLRDAPDSRGVHVVLWMLAFRVESQPLIDAVKAVSVPLFFKVPIPPMELVTDGRVDADYSMRLPRWPMASAGRIGPKRPYIEGFITIEPVYRPKP